MPLKADEKEKKLVRLTHLADGQGNNNKFK
jgi:hypothetical protein